MKEPALRFIEEPYPENTIHKMVHEFQEKGYVILPDVFGRESVDSFVKQLTEIMVFDGLKYTIPDDLPHYIHCAHTPRARQILPFVLSHSIAKPFPCLHTTIIIIETDEKRGYAPEWHKDREPDGMPDEAYHYPLDAFVGFYFEDMTEDHGPTLVIPGSHRDAAMTPHSGAPVEPVYCRKQDALLLDQRVWHRGTPRKAPGNRFLIVYGYYAMPHFYGATFHMPRSQRRAWMGAGSMRERIFFGGPFAPPDKATLKEMDEILDQIGDYTVSFPRQT
jgi:hypothetical protein